MNKKNILQNLLRRALTPAGTNMTRWTMALAVVMISLLAPTTVARAQQGFDTNQYTLTLDLNYEGAKKEYITNISSGSTIILPTPSRDDNIKCLGWATSAEGDVKYKPGDGFVVTQDQTLYAKWDKSTNGTFGDLSWSVTKSDGSADCDVLTISGNGDIEEDSYPWSDFQNSIKTIVIEDGVTSIGEIAFYSFSNVTSLSIPNSVQTIGDEAFYGLTSLTSLTIGNSVQTIGDGAFEDLTSLATDIVLPASLTSIGAYAFSAIAKDTENGISITTAKGSQLESIGSQAFGADAKASIDLSNCTKLTAIVGEQTFLGTMDVTLPHTVTSIAQYAFGKIDFFSGEHVYIVVPEGHVLTVNGEPYNGTLTDGKADLIPYLFDNPGKRAPSNALTLAMEKAVAPVSGTYQLSGDYVSFYDEETNPITEAAVGETVIVSYSPFDPEDDSKVIIPSGKYFTGRYTATEGVTVTMKETRDGTFIMPAKNVSVSAVLADQEEYTLNMTTTKPQVIPESVWLLLNCLDDNYVYDEETEELFLELNGDGKRDVQLKRDYNETTEVTTYSVIRQPGADAITENLRFSFSWDNIDPQQYNSVLFLFKLPAIQPEWITVGDGTALVYNGQAQTPAVTVKDGETDVTSDFDVTYSNNKNACEATADNAPTVTVTAKATSTSFTGSATKTFTIGRKALTLVADKVSIKRGEATPTTFTGSVTGFVDGEELGANDVYYFALDNPAATAVGSYAVTGMLSVNGSEAAANGNYGQNYTFANAADNATAFTIKKADHFNFDDANKMEAGQTFLVTYENDLNEKGVPYEKSFSYSFSPISGVTIDACIIITVKPISVDEAIFEVTENQAEKLTFGNVEWKKSGALLTRPANLTFSGADVDAMKINFTNALTISANSKMTLVDDFGDTVGTITGSKYRVGTAFEGEGSVSLIGSNLIFTTKTEAGISETHNTVMTMGSSEATITFNDCQMTASPNGLGLASNAGADGTVTFASLGGAKSRYKTGCRRYMTRGDKAARPFFSISYSGARIMGKAWDVELQAAEETQAKARGAAEQDITIESGKTYDILTDEDLILTLKLSEGDILITSITLIVPKDSDPNDINGDGDVNAVDLVKAIAAGKTQAEIDAIVNSIMGK